MADDTTPSAAPRRSRLPDRGELPPGTQVGDYVVLGTLASGGFGAVQSAEHRILRRRVALKVLHPDLSSSPEMVQRFVREAQVVNRIRHPNIVDIHDFGTLPDGRPYFVMEMLAGQSLRALIERRGRLPVREALSLLEPVASALQAAHDEGVVHRDLKASNVMVVREGEAPVVKLLDFGIAKLLEPDRGEGLTTAGQRLGTPHSMAPEQIRGGKVDARTDVYALGVLVFQALTGSYPFDADDPLELERLHLESPPPRPSSRAPLAPAIDAVILRALEKDPERRQGSVAALMADLSLAAGLRKPARAAPEPRSALAVYAEARLDPAAADDDAVLTRLADLLSAAEQELLAAGFKVILQTATALLVVRLLDQDPERSRLQRRSAVALSRTLAARTSDRESLRLELQLHAGTVQVEQGPEGPEVSGGELLDPGVWPLARPARGILATEAALVGLDESAAAGGE